MVTILYFTAPAILILFTVMCVMAFKGINAKFNRKISIARHPEATDFLSTENVVNETITDKAAEHSESQVVSQEANESNDIKSILLNIQERLANIESKQQTLEAPRLTMPKLVSLRDKLSKEDFTLRPVPLAGIRGLMSKFRRSYASMGPYAWGSNLASLERLREKQITGKGTWVISGDQTEEVELTNNLDTRKRNEFVQTPEEITRSLKRLDATKSNTNLSASDDDDVFVTP